MEPRCRAEGGFPPAGAGDVGPALTAFDLARSPTGLLAARRSRQDDAFQEVLLRLVRRARSRPEEGIRDVSAHAGCVLRRVLWQWAREGGAAASQPTHDLTEGCEEPSALVSRDEEVARLRGVLRSLPKRDPELLELR